MSGSTSDLHQGHIFPEVKDSGLWLDLNGPHPLDVGLALARHSVLQVDPCEPRACGFVCWLRCGELIPVSLFGGGTLCGDVPTRETKLTAFVPAPDIQVTKLWNQQILIIHSQLRNFNYCRFYFFCCLVKTMKLQVPSFCYNFIKKSQKSQNFNYRVCDGYFWQFSWTFQNFTRVKYSKDYGIFNLKNMQLLLYDLLSTVPVCTRYCHRVPSPGRHTLHPDPSQVLHQTGLLPGLHVTQTKLTPTENYQKYYIRKMS